MRVSGQLPALVGGAVLGGLSAEVTFRLSGRGGVLGAGLGLVTAALVYPAARRERPGDRAQLFEGAAVVVASALAAAAASCSPATGRRIAAAGWAAHAIFDVAQGASDDSRLPGWYAPACAGYDIAFAALLALGDPGPGIG